MSNQKSIPTPEYTATSEVVIRDVLDNRGDRVAQESIVRKYLREAYNDGYADGSRGRETGLLKPMKEETIRFGAVLSGVHNVVELSRGIIAGGDDLLLRAEQCSSCGIVYVVVRKTNEIEVAIYCLECRHRR